ncbi:PorP/SprF family type IX secretion system membrane protein [Algoriphagus marincola]|uniref:PorP/SprF family type IX secretion system membrane protein n=1 Tax=Algoriphagus marincola TaxID=264027 RepID=UPI00041F6B04|nr:type IX secretion system membrane protein PorP/SprF [Algoriphagus marincola]
MKGYTVETSKSQSTVTIVLRVVTGLLFLYMIWFMGYESKAQSRKYISQFSHVQSYLNPGMTGYEGSTLRGFVRNQWAGWEGAPKTYFVSAELDFSQLAGSGELGKNAVGINLLSDEYGAFRETELIISYGTRIQLSKQASLRLGAGVNINQVRLDGNSLNTEQANDPKVMQYLGGFANMNVLDFNLGMSLTHPNYYVSYGVHNVNRGSISNGDVFMDRKPMVNIVQAGYRNRVTDSFTLIMNGMYRSQEDLPDNVELNLKFLLYDRVWIGGGHRFDYANHAQLGMVMGRVNVGYVYEFPRQESYLLPNPTHELMLTFRLFEAESGTINLW